MCDIKEDEENISVTLWCRKQNVFILLICVIKQSGYSVDDVCNVFDASVT